MPTCKERNMKMDRFGVEVYKNSDGDSVYLAERGRHCIVSAFALGNSVHIRTSPQEAQSLARALLKYTEDQHMLTLGLREDGSPPEYDRKD